MINDEQIKNLPDGLLIRTKSGQLKKVQAGRLVDLETKKIPEPARETEIPTQIVEEEQIQQKPPSAALKKADFYFSPEDEKEIEAHREKIKDLAEQPGTFDPELIINKLITKNNLSFADEILKKRFYNIVKSRLDNIRESVETAEALSRSTKIGGMALDQATIDSIMADVESEAAKLHDHETVKKLQLGRGIASPVPERPVARRQPEVLSTLEMPAPIPPKIPFSTPKPSMPAVTEIKKAEEPEFKTAWQTPPLARPQPVIERKVQQPVPRQEIKIRVEQKEETPIYRVGPKPAMPQVIRQPVETGRPQIVDIRGPVKVVGPVEELKEFSLKDFRRIGKTASESIEKIKEKIGLLEEESFTYKTEGIKAWRNSDVNQLYLSMGHEGIESGMSIKNVINKRQAEGKPYLTDEEFQAVADLNGQLNY